MLKLSSVRSRRLLFLVGVATPFGLFLQARAAVSWRPQLVAQQGHVDDAVMRGAHFLHLSPDEKWLVSEDDYQKTSTLWKLANTSQKRSLPGVWAVFSGDSRFVATSGFQEEKIYLDDLFRLLWSKKIPNWDYDVPLKFTSNNTELQYHDPGPYIEGSTITLALKDGRVIGKKVI